MSWVNNSGNNRNTREKSPLFLKAKKEKYKSKFFYYFSCSNARYLGLYPPSHMCCCLFIRRRHSLIFPALYIPHVSVSQETTMIVCPRSSVRVCKRGTDCHGLAPNSQGTPGLGGSHISSKATQSLLSKRGDNT